MTASFVFHDGKAVQGSIPINRIEELADLWTKKEQEKADELFVEMAEKQVEKLEKQLAKACKKEKVKNECT